MAVLHVVDMCFSYGLFRLQNTYAINCRTMQCVSKSARRSTLTRLWVARINKAKEKAALAAAWEKDAIPRLFSASLDECLYFALKARCIPPAQLVVLIRINDAVWIGKEELSSNSLLMVQKNNFSLENRNLFAAG